MAGATILNARDILSGEQGEVWATLPNGDRMCMMHVKNLEASVSYDKEQVPILGKRGKGNRKKGETYSGSMTVYYVTSIFRQYAEQYKNSGKDFYFEIRVINHDNTSRAGTQEVWLQDCNLDSLVLAKVDADSSILDEDMDFTFENYHIETIFDDLTGLFPDGKNDISAESNASFIYPDGYSTSQHP